MQTRILLAEDIARLVAEVGPDGLMDRMIERLETTLLGYSEPAFEVPARDGFSYQRPRLGLIEWMPAMKVGEHTTIKVVGYHPANPATTGLPTILSTVGLYDTDTGHLAGIADATFLTALRTGAASALASSLLARAESQVVGVIGCGAQAVTQLHALSRRFPIERVLMHDVDPAAVASLAARVAGLLPTGVDLRPAPVDLLVASADILCTCTSIDGGEGPLFADRETRPWLHVNAIGADFPGKTELPRALLERSLVVPDFAAQAEREGECQQLDMSKVGPDLIGLVQNQARYADARAGLTVFDSTGHALEDQVAMEMLQEFAEALDLGICVALEASAGDPLNPYDFGAAAISAQVGGVGAQAGSQ